MVRSQNDDEEVTGIIQGQIQPTQTSQTRHTPPLLFAKSSPLSSAFINSTGGLRWFPSAPDAAVLAIQQIQVFTLSLLLKHLPCCSHVLHFLQRGSFHQARFRTEIWHGPNSRYIWGYLAVKRPSMNAASFQQRSVWLLEANSSFTVEDLTQQLPPSPSIDPVTTSVFKVGHSHRDLYKKRNMS